MRKLLYFLIIVCSGLMLPCTIVSASTTVTEDYYSKFRNFTSVEGLSHNRILDIKQDSKGFIWIATAHGLNRYDGYTFKHFVHQAEDSTSIPNNYVTSIDFDINGQMWVGTKLGLASYNSATESFSCFCIHSKAKSGISDPYVRCILGDITQAVLWVETVDGTLNKIDLNSFSIQHYKHQRVMATTYDYHEIFQDQNRKIYVGGRDFGPLVFDQEEESFKHLPVDSKDPTKKRDKDIATIYQDVDGLYWMAATDGFYQYYPANNTFNKRLGTSTFDIIEEDSFYLWLATGNGLMKYHKYNNEFTLFRHNANSAYSLINNHVNVLFKDKDENLWIGTAKGLSLLYKKTNIFTHYRHIPEIKNTMTNDYVRTFLPLKDNKVWIGTHGGGVIQWDKNLQTFETIKGTEGERISTLYEDSHNNIWLGMWSGKGFLKYDNNKKFTHYAYDYNSLKRDWYNDFFEDHKGRFYTGIWGAMGIHFFNRDKGVFEDYSLRLPEAHPYTYLNKVAIQGSNIWTHWNNRTINRYNTKQNYYEGFGHWNSDTFVFPEWRNENHYHYDENIIFTDIYQLVEDRDHELSYWCTNDGLYVYDKGFKPVFKSRFSKAYYMTKLGNEFYVSTEKGLFHFKSGEKLGDFIVLDNHLPFNRIFALNDALILLITEDNVFVYNIKEKQLVETDLSAAELDVLLATNDVISKKEPVIATDKGLVCLNDKLDAYALFNMANSFDKGLISETINDVLMIDQEHYWLGTSKGLLLFDKIEKTFTLVDATHNIAVYDITQKENTLWMATQSGLAQFNTDDRTLDIKSNMTSHKMSSHLTNFIEEDALGNIWVGTSNNGVNIMDTVNYDIHQFLSNTEDENAFWGKDATDMTVDNDGHVYISSEEGINLYKPSDSTFIHITEKDGLPSNDILGMAFDDEGFLWIVSSAALSVYNPKDGYTHTYGEEWGLHSYLFNGDLTLAGKQMLLPTDQGFYAFIPSELRKQHLSNLPGFTGLKIFADERNSDMIKHGKVVLNYNENFFTISFSDFDFSEASTKYYYKLEGIDPDWVETRQNYAAYTNIKHGEYKLLLTTENNRTLNIAPVQLLVAISPPYWKRTWFILLELLLGFSIFYTIYRQRINSFKQRERNLITEQKLLRSQMNPHFVFNALIAIQSFIYKNEQKEAGHYLSKFAKLMRLFLLNTRQEYILLSQEEETLEHYLELQRLRFDNSFDYNISCDKSLANKEIKIPPMMAQPFIENAIEHGFKSITYKGEIMIVYKLKNKAIEITIKDNGIGIKQSKDNQEHKSLATVITRERLKCLSTRFQEYSLKIENLNDTDEKGTGTIVHIIVPYINAYSVD